MALGLQTGNQHRMRSVLPSGKHTKSYWKWWFSSWIYPLKMVIFHRFLLTFTRGYRRRVSLVPGDLVTGNGCASYAPVFSALDQAAQGMPLFYVSFVHQRERDLSSIRVESHISRLCKFMQVYASLCSFHQNQFKVPTKIVQKWRSLATKRHKLSKGLVSQDHLVHARFLSLQNFQSITT